MAIQVSMPQLSDTMHEGKILTWRKKEGEQVSRGDALAEVQTDKADLEIEAFHDGVLLRIDAPAGTTVKVGSIIAVIGEKGESIAAPQNQPAGDTSSPPPANFQKAAPLPQQASTQMGTPPPALTRSDDERIKISPLARNIATTHGVEISNLTGSGEGGRIVRRDVEKFLGKEVSVDGEDFGAALSGNTPSNSRADERQRQGESLPPPQTSGAYLQAEPAPARPQMPSTGVSTEPLSSMRATIAKRMVESVTSIPHFYVTSAIRMDELSRMKDSLKPLPQYQGITYNHLVMKGVALALKTVPIVNAHYENGNLIQPRDVHIGIVTAVSGGLLIPVLKHADKLALAEIVSEARSLVQRARSGRPKGDDLTGGTFSISNMGMFAVESFTAIINPGQGAILAISAIEEEPVVVEKQIRPGLMMRPTLSVDHRIIDGVMAGEFLTELKRVLEDPVLLLA